MLDEASMQALRAILVSDDRPWPRVTMPAAQEYVAELRFPKGSGEAQALTVLARTLGFEVTIGDRLALSEAASVEAAHILVLTIKGLGGAAATLAALKAAVELPESLRKLREALRPYFGRASDLAPALQLDVVKNWLDTKYGATNWR
jgi:hypothetical protein